MAIQEFFRDMFEELSGISRMAWLLILFVGLISTLSEIAHWSLGAESALIGYLLLGISAPAWFAAAYMASMAMIEREARLGGFFRFVATTALLGSPIVAGIAGAAILVPGPGQDAVMAITLALIVAGWMLLALLPALPLTQALSLTLVPPVRLFHATGGHRLALLLIAFLTSSLNRLIPGASIATTIPDAITLALVNGLVAAGTVLFVACVGVTSWRWSLRNDPALEVAQA